jgi:hypothetical protein
MSDADLAFTNAKKVMAAVDAAKPFVKQMPSPVSTLSKRGLTGMWTLRPTLLLVAKQLSTTLLGMLRIKLHCTMLPFMPSILVMADHSLPPTRKPSLITRTCWSWTRITSANRSARFGMTDTAWKSSDGLKLCTARVVLAQSIPYWLCRMHYNDPEYLLVIDGIWYFSRLFRSGVVRGLRVRWERDWAIIFNIYCIYWIYKFFYVGKSTKPL